MKFAKPLISIVAALFVSSAFAADGGNTGRQTTEVEKAFRLNQIRTSADVEALSHLDADEKALGKALLRKIPDSHGWAILGNDPELQALWHTMERVYMGLFESFQGVPLGAMNLIALETSLYAGSDYVYGLFATLTARQMAAYNMPVDYYGKLAVVGSPDSPMWTDEERLVLEFTRASLENRMSDELFEQARETWGEKRLLRTLAWMSYVQMWSNVSNVLDLKFDPDMLPAGESYPPEVVAKLLPKMQETRAKFLEFVTDDLSTFPGGIQKD